MNSPLSSSIAPRLSEILGQDLRSVRIHAGSQADAVSRRFHSAAFACGSNVFFRQGHYNPHSKAGLELIAHEVIHVCQQLSNRLPRAHQQLVVRPNDDEFEHEARALARPVAALLRGAEDQVSDSEYAALRDFRSRPKLQKHNGLSGVIQRTPASLVAAANVAPPAPAAPGPTTCHEAAIGWLLSAENYTSPWKLMRYAMSTFVLPVSAGSWLKAYIYNYNSRLHLADAQGVNPLMKPNPGDILFTYQGGLTAMHSMIVVPGPGNHVRVRGFNNAGTFNYPALAIPAPAGAYDPNDRDIADPALWDVTGTGFGANNANAQLYWVRYQNAAQAIRRALAHWTHSHFRGPNGGHGWQHTGAPPCHPSCPH